MAITVKHSKVSTIPDDADTSLVRPSDWNADHTLVGLGTAAELDAGVPNGVATLDAGGKVPVSELPAAVLGALSYQGTWDASTNTPTLTSSVGTKGYYYVVSVAGSTNLNGITDWVVGDWAVYNGTVWQKVDNTDAGGDVVGPASATDNAIARFDTTTGKLLQNSVVLIGDTGSITGVNALTAESLVVNNNVTLGSSNTDTIDVNARITTDLEPNANNAKDIGTSGRNWRDGFFGRTVHTVNLAVTGTTSFDGLEGTSGQVLTSQGTGVTPVWTTPTVGTVTSVTGTAPVVSSGGATPAISLATAYGDTQNPYASKTANFVLAAPNGSAGVPTFRAIVAADIPTLNQNTTGTASNVTGTVALANGGTGQTTKAPAFNALSPITTTGDLIIGNGSNSATRLAIGTNAQVLTSNGTTATWATPSGGSAATPTALGTVYGYTNNVSTRVALGYNALANATGKDNIGIGFSALQGVTTGVDNVGIGRDVMNAGANTTLSYAVAVGAFALLNTTSTGTGNVAVGWSAGKYMAGANNVFLGYGAGSPNGNTTNASGSGTNNIVIGYNAISSSGTVSNETTIGNSSTTAARIFGNLALQNGGITEVVFAATGTTPALSPNNGSIQTWTLSGSSTPTAGTWAAGSSMTLQITASTNTVTWTSLAVSWIGGSAPTLATSGVTVIELWKVGTTIYGALVGSA